jgi:hypothetical protein
MSFLQLDDYDTFDSILATKMKFDLMIIEMDHFLLKDLQKVMAILVFHGRNIKTLYVDKCKCSLESLGLNQSALVTWLSFMPALEYASFSTFEDISFQNYVQTDDTVLNLPNLEKVRFPPLSFASVLHRLPRSSLECLLLANATPLPNIEKIFERHCDTLTELEFFCCFPYTDATIFHQLQLETLHIHAPEPKISDQFIIAVLSHQKKLKALSLGDIGSNETILVTENLLRTICGLKELQKLEIGEKLSIFSCPNF